MAGGWTVRSGVSLTEARPPGGTLSGRLLADGGAISEWPAERSDGGAALADEGGAEASAGAHSSGAQHPPRRAVPPSPSPRERRHRARGAPRARGGEGGGRGVLGLPVDGEALSFSAFLPRAVPAARGGGTLAPRR